MPLSICVSRQAARAQDDSLLPVKIALEDRDKLERFVNVRDFEFSGNTVFTHAQLLAAPVVSHTEAGKLVVEKRVSDFTGREISFDELEEVRVAITMLYVNAGYINSGAVIPDQTADNGIVKIQIVEGRLSDINVHGNKRLKPNYFADRIRLGAPGPLNINQLKDQLEIVRQNPNVQRINAQLHPGDSPGKSYLDVDVDENPGRQFSISFNNYRPPSVGAERVELAYSQNNVVGLGDSIDLRYGLTQGRFERHEDRRLRRRAARFSDRLHDPRDLTPAIRPVQFSYDRTDDIVAEQPFQGLNITSETSSYAITLRQPIYRTPRSELALFATGEIRRNSTDLLGEGFAFPPDVNDGKSNETVVRFGQEFNTRDTRQALALRSTFSFGLNAFNATDNRAADGQFVTWLGQLQYIHKIGQSDAQWIYRINAQFSTDSLLTLEQFAVGGVDTVRGYPENFLVRDNGITSSLEARLPVLNRRPGDSIIELVPFFDAGYSYNANGLPTGQLISSAGLGILFHPTEHIHAELYWGHPFTNFRRRTSMNFRITGFIST